MPERLYNTHQIAQLLGASPSMVVAWMEKGLLPFERGPNGPLRVSEKGLITFLKHQNIDIEEVMAKILGRERGEGPSEQTSSSPSPQLATEVVATPGAGEEIPTSPAEEGEDEVIDVGMEPQTQPTQPFEASEPPTELDEPGEYEPHEITPEPPAEDQATPAQGGEHRPLDSVPQVAEAILEDAFTRGTTHIHLEQRNDDLILRLRIDGVMHDRSEFTADLPESIAPRLIDTIKSFPSEGPSSRATQFTRTFAGRTVAFRLRQVPTIHGEKIVLGVLDRQVAYPGLGGLNLSVEQEKLLKLLTRQSDGLIVVCGPRRSGRKCIFAGLVQEIDRSRRSVTMIGREPEFGIDRITCAQTSEETCETIRSLIGADTDVILIDELADEESVLAAVNAANDGVLVLAGISAKDVPDALEQILGTSPPPWVLGSSLLGILTAHQVRKPCEECRSRKSPDNELLARLGLPRGQVPSEVWVANQCERCFKTGYRGVSMLLSVLVVERTIAQLIRTSAPPGPIIEAATDAGMRSLGHAAMEMIRDGTTTLEELARVLP